MWAPGTPRNDISPLDLLNYDDSIVSSQVKNEIISQYATIEFNKDPKASCSCRIADKESIENHLYLTAKLLMAQIALQKYITLQEMIDMNAPEQRAYFFEMLKRLAVLSKSFLYDPIKLSTHVKRK